MHTMAGKATARERELAPRYYYKRSHTSTCTQKIKNAFRTLLAFMFTQVGVCAVIATYMVIGAFIFEELESESQEALAKGAARTRANYTRDIWVLTHHYNVLAPNRWKEGVTNLVEKFQNDVVDNVKNGWAGNDPGVNVWTFSSALMYSLTVFTTIGYGNLTPRTNIGKLVTIFYAIIGIPLMFIYMANIGSILATTFKYTYMKLCRCNKKPKDLPKKACLPSIREDTVSFQDEESQEFPSRRSSKISSKGTYISRDKDSEAVKNDKHQTNGNASISPPEDTEKVGNKFKNLVHFKSKKKKKDDKSDATENGHGKLGRRKSENPYFYQKGNSRNELVSYCQEPEGGRTPRSLCKEPIPQKDLDTKTIRSKETDSIKNGNAKDTASRSSSTKSAASRMIDRLTSRTSKKSDKDDVVEFKLVEDLRLVTIPVTTCLLVLASYIVFGAILFAAWEGWNYMDGAYFCFVSLLTIGFGDFVPGNSYIYNVSDDMSEKEANAKLILGTVYILLGMALLSMSFNLMQEKIVSNVRAVARSLGLIRDTMWDADVDSGF